MNSSLQLQIEPSRAEPSTLSLAEKDPGIPLTQSDPWGQRVVLSLVLLQSFSSMLIRSQFVSVDSLGVPQIPD